jgi:hypothetical protein
MDNLESKIKEESGEDTRPSRMENIKDYVKGCIHPDNARLYGTFQERAALNITQFPKIQGSLLIRMGLVYPIISYLVDEAGLPTDAKTDFFGVAINYHTWVAGYLAYLVEIQAGMSKYPLEFISRGINKVKTYFSKEKM